ncbi:hypothetical protein GRX03_15295 [Halovenus sp. WSH3]|uniref:DUF7511 domain-containing protein n=1 Tax=Halovenus carboxidivorans TaxID=2692199 RepID=A0A6B0T4I1_9EURY|nr:hypothetical protein [Halovenus carboxidivorans]MXR52964.1 hypothetical protein [Halovenus carboxidivorans]
MSEQIRPRGTEYELDSQIECRRNQPDLCTIYRSEPDEMREMSGWITAKGDAFVDAQAYR